MTKARILVADDELSMREMVSILLKRHGYDVMTARSGRQVKELLDAGEAFDLIVTDLVMDHGGGINVISSVKSLGLGTEVIVFTAFGTAETAVEAMKMGAFDYIAKPFNVDEFMISVRQALERRALIRENTDLRARVHGRYKFADIVGRSEPMCRVVTLCRKVADSQATVLISGESGTGKEVVARALHFSGAKADRPFVPVNCGALPEHLMESELFGHMKGSFTGAVQDEEGLICAADKGTVFLDEIGELPLPLQVKLLRVLQERTVRPVGASKEIPIDVRVIAATNRDLGEQMANGHFRSDLFYRLNVISIVIPPLRDRREDIPLLADHLLDRLASDLGAATKRISGDAMRCLMQYDYPGNVRELANILERAVTLSASDEIAVDDLPAEVMTNSGEKRFVHLTLPEEGVDLDKTIETFEKNLIEQALGRTNGIRTRAAELLGISFRSLRYRLKKLGMATDDDED